MVTAFSFVTQMSNAVLIFLCGIVLLFLLKSIKLNDKLWLASVVSILIIVLITLSHTASYYSLAEKLREQEEALNTLKVEYAVMKSQTDSARATFGDAKRDVALSRTELNELQSKVNAEFDRTVREIRSVYADISDEELNRRFNNAVRKARQNFQKNVFQ